MTDVRPPAYGELARTRCTATGLSLGGLDALVLYVSAQDNDFGIDEWDPDGDAPHPDLPVPTRRELAAAATALRYRRTS